MGTNNNFPGIGYKTQGQDFNYFQKINFSNTTFGGDSIDGYQPTCVITFPTQGVIFLLNSGTGTIEYSFNGYTVHGEMSSGQPNSGLTFDNRNVSMIWFRVQAGSSGSFTISVHAWGVR